MSLALVLIIVAAQRLGEVFYAERNTRALLRRGATEVAPEQHKWFVVLHTAWLLTMWLFIPHDAVPNWWLIGVFAALQLLRIWVIATLGAYWTTRIIALPNAPLVSSGPYRFLRHPNYAIVVCEIAILPLAFGAWAIALAFTLFNAALLTWRIRAEDRSLSSRVAE